MDQLPSVLRSLMIGVSGGTAWTAADWLDLWRDVQADDNRIAHSLRLILPLAPPLSGVTVEIVGTPTAAQLFPDVLVHHPAGTATMPDLVAAARALLAEAAPPEPPPGNQPVQMSLF